MASALAALLAGCGTPPADLFVADRTGTIPGAKLHLRVDDGGTAYCDGEPHEMPSKLLILSRVLVNDLSKPAKRGRELPPGPSSILRYRIRTEDGIVAFSDTSRGQPPVFYRAADLIRQIAIRACRLPR